MSHRTSKVVLSLESSNILGGTFQPFSEERDVGGVRRGGGGVYGDHQQRGPMHVYIHMHMQLAKRARG